MFTVRHDTPLSPDQAWARVTDWTRHAQFVPLTRIVVDTPGPTRVGTMFTARTAIGGAGFDDVMEVVTWDPPRWCRIEKRGTAVSGWAELSVEPRIEYSRVTWREEAIPAHLPRAALRANDLAGRVLFKRVLKGLLSRP